MYLEFILLVFDYFKTLTKKFLFFEWGIPLLIAAWLLWLDSSSCMPAYKNFKDSAINILGILLGFSIAIITIITTGSGDNLEGLKLKETDFRIGIRKLTLYDLILINFTYSVIVEILIIAGSLLVPLIASAIDFSHKVKVILYSLLVFAVLHILLLTLRNLTDFYFIVTKKPETPPAST